MKKLTLNTNEYRFDTGAPQDTVLTLYFDTLDRTVSAKDACKIRTVCVTLVKGSDYQEWREYLGRGQKIMITLEGPDIK